MDICKTVKVKSTGPGGHTVINESDFDPNVHELFEPAAEAAPVADGKTQTTGPELKPGDPGYAALPKSSRKRGGSHE